MKRKEANESTNGNSRLIVALDYQRKPETDMERVARERRGERLLTDSDLTSNYIEHAVQDTHSGGLEGQLRRTYSRLQRKLDEAIDKGKKSIELAPDEKDLLRKSFRECKVPAGFAKFFMVLEEEVERAVK